MADHPGPPQFNRAGFAPGEWLVPVEMVLATTSSALAALVHQRFARGEVPKPGATVLQRGDRFFGKVEFQGEKYAAIFLALDVWTMEGQR